MGSGRGPAARVVSRKPLDPNEPPMETPRLPTNSLESRRGIIIPANESSMQEPPKPTTIATTSSALPGAANRLWSYICAQIGSDLPFPVVPELIEILNLPMVRDLTLERELLPNLVLKQLSGLIIHVVGEENPNPCTECRRHDAPLKGCVSLSLETTRSVIGYLGTSSRACANCLLRKRSSACSLRKLSALPNLPDVKRRMKRKFDDSFDLDDQNSLLGIDEEPLGSRPSRRFSVSDASEHWEEEDEEEEPVASEVLPEPKRKIITLRTQPTSHNPRPQRQSRALTWTDDPVPETDLQMEEWEMDSGRVAKAGEDGESPLVLSLQNPLLNLN